MFIAALAILLTWAVVAIVLIGVGSLILRRFDSDYSLMHAFWMGLAASVALLEIWNFFWPVNAAITMGISGLGVAGIVVNRVVLFHRLAGSFRTSRWLIAFSLAILLLLALRASGPCDYADTSLYGAPAVRWFSTYSVVPGLANLHCRLGLNSSVFLCIAALNQGPWHGLGFHLFAGFVFAAFWFTLLPACFRLIAGSSASPADWFYCILTIPIAFLTARAKIVGTLTDEPATIACLVAAGILFEELRSKNGPGDSKPNPARLVTACSLFALALAFKQSTIVFAPLAWLLAFRWIWLTNQPAAKRKMCLASALLLATAILLPWCARGVVLSGYPIFPAAVLGFPVDWKLPIGVMHWYVAAIGYWGRFEEMGIAKANGLTWLRAWLDVTVRNRAAFQVPLMISLAGSAIVLGHRSRKRAWAFYPWLWLLVPSFAGALFWFFVSPAPRYGQFSIWATAGTLGTWGIVSMTSGPRRDQLTKIVLAGLAGLLIWCLISFGWKQPYERLLTAPPLAPLPEPRLTVRHTLSGLAVFVPVEGDQCWDAPLPCTPYFDETLRLRDPQSLRSGFTSTSQGNQLPRF
jgi:hypothetical protein